MYQITISPRKNPKSFNKIMYGFNFKIIFVNTSTALLIHSTYCFVKFFSSWFEILKLSECETKSKTRFFSADQSSIFTSSDSLRINGRKEFRNYYQILMPSENFVFFFFCSNFSNSNL